MDTKSTQQSLQIFLRSNFWFLFFTALIFVFPFFESLRAHFNDYNYPPLNPHFRYILIAFIALLYIVYAKASRTTLDAPDGTSKLPPWWMAATLAYAAVIPPLFSIDLYEYVIRGRMSAIYGLNPFTCAPDAASQDPLYPIIFWKGAASCYGPLWNIIANYLVKLSGPAEYLNTLAFKACALAAHLASAFFVYRIAQKIFPSKNGYMTALFLLNPYLIFMNLVEAHNDVFMMLFVLAAIWCLTEKKYTFAVVILGMSIAVKYITVILLPVFFLHVYRAELSPRSKAFFTVGSATALMLLLYAFSAPFGMTPLNIASSFKGIVLNLETNTIPYLTHGLLSAAGLKLSVADFRFFSNMAFLLAGALIYLSLLRKNSGGIKPTINACLWIFLAYLALASFQFGNWYVVWIAPLMLLGDFRKKNVLFLLVTFAALIAFWKRINFLMIAAALAYLAARFAPDRAR